MISRVKEGEGGEAANDLVMLSASGRVKEDPGGSGVISRGRSINSVEVGGTIHGGRIRRWRLEVWLTK
jgi:hypothetical protein